MARKVLKDGVGEGGIPYEDSCEMCRVLVDIVRAIRPGDYQCGDLAEVGGAVANALVGHVHRKHDKEIDGKRYWTE